MLFKMYWAITSSSSSANSLISEKSIAVGDLVSTKNTDNVKIKFGSGSNKSYNSRYLDFAVEKHF